MKKLLVVLFVLTACCRFNNYNNNDGLLHDACVHSQKLRSHFLGHRVGDLSSLISETRVISQRLKAAGKYSLANKFDSYSDVLMYGNNTLAESVHDMKALVQFGSPCCCR